MTCDHGIVEIWKDKLQINTMTDWIPVKYCPQCGKQLTFQDVIDGQNRIVESIKKRMRIGI